MYTAVFMLLMNGLLYYFGLHYALEMLMYFSVFTKTYNLNFEDPLLRINLHCITIVCRSMPFFAANIRSLFHKINLPINRSLHFHPEPGKEMYYIEIQTKDTEIIKNVTEQITL